MYYIAKVKFESIDENGKIKKLYEQYLVSAVSVSDAEDKLIERFKESISEFGVVSVVESKILGVIN
jgi:hypothetical protein